MLIKEYRIPLPLTVEEYRIAQLYMIAVSAAGAQCLEQESQFCLSPEQKKSRDESKGAGSGVEIITNEPYDDGPGGQGQYTQKIYHVGSHLPGWIKGTYSRNRFCFAANHITYILSAKVCCQKAL